MRKKEKTVSLVLGSGSARGMAHIGVIRLLEDRGYQIQSISGTSIGSLIGGFYCAGKLELYHQWLLELDRTSVLRLLDFSFDRRGLLKGEKVLSTLKEIIGDYDIEELPIKYTAVATDIEREKEVWLSEGSMFEAIRASIAVPSIFTPHYYRGMKLMDGGLLNPVPVAPTAGDTTELTIAVNLNGKSLIKDLDAKNDRKLSTEANGFQKRLGDVLERVLPDKKNVRSKGPATPNMIEMTTRSIDIMQNTIAHAKMSIYKPDILIEIPRDACGFFDFHKAEEMIDIGYSMADTALNNWHEHHPYSDEPTYPQRVPVSDGPIPS
ncbi:patatin-like phospholipase family protein [Gynuella sp.]|uniref:patatin-like phospholipase family protein n=1 Tax=Gynuella sp. TaxID=2969146 RepID=UPI003D0FCBFF